MEPRREKAKVSAELPKPGDEPGREFIYVPLQEAKNNRGTKRPQGPDPDPCPHLGRRGGALRPPTTTHRPRVSQRARAMGPAKALRRGRGTNHGPVAVFG